MKGCLKFVLWAVVALLVLAGIGLVFDSGDTEPATTTTSAPAQVTTAAPATTQVTAAAPVTTLATTSSRASTTTAPAATTSVQSTTTPPTEPTSGAADGLVGIRIAPENEGCGYSREPFDTYDRAAVIDAHSRSFYLDRPVGDGTGFDVEHVVAAKEACESGLARDLWGTFGSDVDNLVMAVSGLNRSKADRDIAEWGAGSNKWPTGDIPAGRWCAYVVKTRDVKAKYGLTMDSAEAAEMEQWLRHCDIDSGATPTTATTVRPTTSTARPTTTTMRPTTTTRPATTTTRTSRPLPRTCGAAEEAGWTASEFRRAWEAAGRPSKYDRDNDGIPCESL